MTKLKILAIAFGAIALTACKNDCEKAADRVEAKLTDCDIDIPDDTADDTAADDECSDADGEQALCVADCTDDADCGALDGSDADAMTAYFECLGEC